MKIFFQNADKHIAENFTNILQLFEFNHKCFTPTKKKLYEELNLLETNLKKLKQKQKYITKQIIHARKKKKQDFNCEVCTYMVNSEMYKITDISSTGNYKSDIKYVFQNQSFQELFEKYFKSHSSFIAHFETEISFKKILTNEFIPVHFHSKHDKPLTNINDLQEYLQMKQNQLINQISEYEGRGSDLIYQQISKIIIKMKKYNPSTGGSYIPLPKQLTNTLGYVNVKNENHECFKYALMSALHLKPNPKCPKQYEYHFPRYNWSNLEFPVVVKKSTFETFEKNNPNIPPLNIHILNNYDDLLPQPFYVSQKPGANSKEAINVLYYTKSDFSNGHFVYMKNPSRALRKLTKCGKSKYPCVNCYSMFYSEEKLGIHSRLCLTGNTQIKEVPKEGKIKFQKFHTKQEIPVMLICDTEAINLPQQENEVENTKIISKQKCVGYYIYFLVADKYEKVFPEYVHKSITYTGMDASEHFLKSVIHHGKIISKKIASTNIPMKYSTKTSDCHICELPLREDEKRVADHDHLTGDFRGWTHQNCNINYHLSGKSIPIIMHNLKGYDLKMFIKELSKFKNVEYYPIVENSEKFKCLRMNFKDTYIECGDKIKKPASCLFIDSLAHMNSSLEKLTQILANYSGSVSFPEYVQQQDITFLRNQFPAVSNSFPNDKHFKLILRKGVFPYDYFTSLDILKRKEPLERKHFYSKLYDEHISPEDYEFYLEIRKELNLDTFEKHYQLYLKLDTLLLADVCKSFKNTCLETYQLDPFWYVSAPSLAWQAALKMTKVELDHLEDVDMYNFLKEGIKGGVSYVAKKYSKANNNKIPDFSPEHPSVFIDYLDANNLYGYSMMQNLPVGGFKWVKPNKRLYPRSDKFGYIYEADLEYPSNLHDKHNDLPLAPEKVIINNQTKLIPHFNDRKNYVVDGENLKFYVEHGMKITDIHRVLRYKKEAWLKPYIDLNTKLRAESKFEFHKDFFKLMNNSVYGQTLMDVTRFSNFELVTTKKRYDWLNRKPHLIKNEPWVFPCTHCNESTTNIKDGLTNESFKVESKDCTCLVRLEKIKLRVILDRPIYVGFKILELSKHLMYLFWYDVLKKHYGDRIKLLATDTDSFIIEIHCKNIDEEMSRFKSYFDFSNYESSALYNVENKKVPGKFKREYPNQVITKFIGLRSKCYYIEFLNDERMNEGMKEIFPPIKIAKGVKKSTKKKQLSGDDYERALNDEEVYVTETKLQSRKMEMHVIEQKKLALSANDDKRVYFKDGQTYAHGHYAINVKG